MNVESIPACQGGLRLRTDLIHQRLHMGSHAIWVIKDPIAGRFYYFNDREFTILQSLDGRSPSKIIGEFVSKYANDYLSADVLVSFLAQIRRSGLLHSSEASHDDSIPNQSSLAARPRDQSLRLRKSTGAAGMLSPLAIRLPGINPDRFLDRLAPRLRWLFTPLALITLIATVVSAAVVAVIRSDVLVAELRIAPWWTTPSMLIALLVVMSMTKIVHELGHAVACKHYGGSCPQIGLMFLVFVPCLYCDVSDAWLQPSRAQRILISAAGMIAELFVAAVATMLWAITVPGAMHWVCLSVMVVCSISTILFNGNPLMRYDGYYILSDLVRIPNLASSSSMRLEQSIKGWVFGIRGLKPSVDSRRQHRLMLSYAALSLVYRVFVIGAILFAVHKFTMAWQLQLFAWIVTVWMFAMLSLGLRKSLLRVLPSGAERRGMAAGRATKGVVATILLLAIVLLCPVPRSISAPYLIELDQHQEIFSTVPGIMIDARRDGEYVSAGEPIATLSNRELQLESRRLEVEQESLQNRLARIQTLRSADQSVSREIPALRESIESAGRQRELLEHEMQQLAVRSAHSGILFAAHHRQRQEDDARQPESWHGSPLNPENRGSYIDRGTLIGIVGSPKRSVALLVSQRNIDFVRPGQRVAIHSPGVKGSTVYGRVDQISSQKTIEVDSAVIAKKLLPVDPQYPTKPLEAVYRVDVRIEEPWIENPLPLRQAGVARIQVDWTPMLWRAGRFLADSLRFELQ